MAYNPKGKELKDILAKDISKKTMEKIAKKATDAKSAIPCFFKHNFKFADGKEGPLLIAGKIKQFKAELIKLKTADEVYALMYVKTAEDGSRTTVWSPIRGKFHTKDSLFGKTLKAAFTKVWEKFEIGAELDPKAAEAAEAAADSLEDVADEPEAAAAAAPAAPDKKEEGKKDDGGAGKLIGEVADFLKGKVKDVVTNIKAKSATDADKSVVDEVFDKVEQLKGIWKGLPDPVKTLLTKGFEQVAAQFPALEKIRENLKGLGNGKVDDNDLEQFLKKIANGVDKIGNALDKAVDGAKKAISKVLPSGADLLKRL